MIWDSVHKQICENIIEHAKPRWELCIKFKGRRFDNELLRKIPKVKRNFKWRMKSAEINVIRESYKDKFVIKGRNKRKRNSKKNRKTSKRIIG